MLHIHNIKIIQSAEQTGPGMCASSSVEIQMWACAKKKQKILFGSTDLQNDKYILIKQLQKKIKIQGKQFHFHYFINRSLGYHKL